MTAHPAGAALALVLAVLAAGCAGPPAKEVDHALRLEPGTAVSAQMRTLSATQEALTLELRGVTVEGTLLPRADDGVITASLERNVLRLAVRTVERPDENATASLPVWTFTLHGLAPRIYHVRADVERFVCEEAVCQQRWAGEVEHRVQVE